MTDWLDPHDPFVRYPKVALHDHLDGSVLPTTLIELALADGHWLPTSDPEELQRWYRGTSELPPPEDWELLFSLSTSVMQTPENLRRVASEYVATAAEDGVVYAETRWAPEKHQLGGMTLDDAVLAVRDGLEEGMAAAERAGRRIVVVQLLSAMRNTDRSLEIAALAARHVDAGVVGLDLAGHEEEYPAHLHADAFQLARAEGVRRTVHAGEMDGAASVEDALESCAAERIGHGARVVEDISIDGRAYPVGEALAAWEATGLDPARTTLGPIAQRLVDEGVALELCPSSNSHPGGVVDHLAQHPVDLLKRLGIPLTINPDNRLIIAGSITGEFRLLADRWGWTPDDFRAVTLRAIDSGFAPAELRERIRDTVIGPGYA